MNILRAILLIVSLYLVSQVYTFYVRYRNAQKTGLRIVWAPLDPFGMPFMTLINILRPIMAYLPDSLSLGSKLMDLEWSWKSDDKYQKELGLNFLVVTPARTVMITGDPVAIAHILQKRKEFPKPKLYEVLDIFGRNVDSVNGEDWARQRKITAPCFNEKVSSLVWDESLRQSRQMVSSWLSAPNGIVSNMTDDTRIVALHVLTSAGLGISHDFSQGARKPTEGHTMSHRDSLMMVLHNFIPVIFAKKMGKMAQFLGPTIRKAGIAAKEFEQYMDEMIAHERESMQKSGDVSKPNLISTLIRTSDQSKDGGPNALKLSDDEIKGNLFIFNFAGHDTTANTLAYAFANMALHPEVQEWVAEELAEVLRDEEQPVYEDVYPRLKRAQAVMYETIRLYGPAPMMPRDILPNTPIQITNPEDSSKEATIVLPEVFSVSLNPHAAQTSSSVFPSPKSFMPGRWIKPGASLNDETLLPAPLGYTPWSHGPRICPGMKFSQVEFTAVLSTVLRTCRIEPSMKANLYGAKGMDTELCKKEVRALIRDSGLHGGTLCMRNPADLCLRIVKR
ncbi:cytochrome P450 [Clohesyomyces aquaticus]|uniref:Cytochrome P450 n=1 Tax=Clohesyomyces aquaticus TaxID=1231657 RepID=A0A1Y1YYL5_9PLEO|nr:cytochrome P450 [Clohesyomyces aquaticus]